MKTRQFIIEDTVDIAISDSTIGPTLPIKGMNNYNSVITTANTARVPLEMNIRYPIVTRQKGWSCMKVLLSHTRYGMVIIQMQDMMRPIWMMQGFIQGKLPHILTCCHDSVMYIIFSELNHFVFFINTFMKNKHILTTNKSIWRALL